MYQITTTTAVEVFIACIGLLVAALMSRKKRLAKKYQSQQEQKNVDKKD